jgi:hypothetical protein
MEPNIEDIQNRPRSRIPQLSIPAETISLDADSLGCVHDNRWAVNIIAPDSVNRTLEFYAIIANVNLELDYDCIHVTFSLA